MGPHALHQLSSDAYVTALASHRAMADMHYVTAMTAQNVNKVAPLLGLHFFIGNAYHMLPMIHIERVTGARVFYTTFDAHWRADIKPLKQDAASKVRHKLYGEDNRYSSFIQAVKAEHSTKGRLRQAASLFDMCAELTDITCATASLPSADIRRATFGMVKVERNKTDLINAAFLNTIESAANIFNVWICGRAKIHLKEFHTKNIIQGYSIGDLGKYDAAGKLIQYML